MLKTCLECIKQFETSHERRKFCSKKCYLIDRVRKHLVPKSAFKKGELHGKQWKKGCPAPPTAFKKGLIPWNKNKALPELSAENHPNWNGGEYSGASGYNFIINREKPSRYMKKSRFVMEQHLGRKLKKEEVVHHINGIKDDDRIENLMLFPNNTEHMKYHASQKIIYNM